MRRFMMVPAFVLALSLAAGFSAGDAAGEPCLNGSAITCVITAFGTGCVGLANKSGQNIRVKVTSNNYYEKLFMAGMEQKADYKNELKVFCFSQSGGEWKGISCDSVFDITHKHEQGRRLRVPGFLVSTQLVSFA